MSRRGVLLDWGGVLTTSPFASFAAFADAEGIDPALLPGPSGHRTPLDALFARLEAGGVTDEAFERSCAALLGLDPARAEGLRRRMFASMRADHAMRRSIFALRSSGVRTGLLSNSVGTGGYDRRTLEELFDVIVISGDEGVRKPDPEIYAIALTRMGLPARDVVFVDDLPANLPPAQALGIATVLHTDAATTVAALESLLGVQVPRVLTVAR